MTDLTRPPRRTAGSRGRVRRWLICGPTSSANVTPSFTTVKAQPSWKSVISLASTTTYNVSEDQASISRGEMDIVTTADGSQNPYVIAAGLGGQRRSTWISTRPATNLHWTAMLSNTQGTLSYTLSNGLSGSSLVSVAVAAQQAGYKDSPLSPMKSLWGWKVALRLDR